MWYFVVFSGPGKSRENRGDPGETALSDYAVFYQQNRTSDQAGRGDSGEIPGKPLIQEAATTNYHKLPQIPNKSINQQITQISTNNRIKQINYMIRTIRFQRQCHHVVCRRLCSFGTHNSQQQQRRCSWSCCMQQVAAVLIMQGRYTALAMVVGWNSKPL